MRRARFKWAVAGVAAAMAAGACSGPHVPPEVRRAGKALDRVEAGVEEWGTVTVSAPLLEAPDGSRFKFDLTKHTAEDYFADAQKNVQGRAAEFEQVVNQFGLGVDVAMNPMIADQYAANVGKYYQQQREFEAGEATRKALAQRQLDLRLRAADSRYREQAHAAQVRYDADLAAAKAKRDEAVRKATAERDAVKDNAGSTPAQREAAEEKLKADTAAAGAAYESESRAATATRDAAVADADRARAEAVPPPEPETAPTYPEPAAAPASAPDTLAPDAEAARKVLAAEKFADFMSLIGKDKRATISDRTAIDIAAGDVATAAIFGLLGDPNAAKPFQDRQVLFGVSMVAVNPGWRTRKGYAADVAVTCRYAYRPARREVVQAFVEDEGVDPKVRRWVADAYGITPKSEAVRGVDPAKVEKRVPPGLRYKELHADQQGVPADGGPSPLVAAVSPMTETQTLDLESSYRRQHEVAIKLSFALHAAGLTAQAAAFDKFVKSQQQDVETATAVNTVNAYSHVGGMFGFQVGPRLVAIEKVRKGTLPGAAEVLDRQSFPVLVIFGVNRSEAVRLKAIGKDGVVVYEAQIELVSQPEWMPTEDATSDTRLLPSRRLALAYDMARSGRELQAEVKKLPKPEEATPEQNALRPIGELVDVHRHALQYKAFGGVVDLLLPVGVFEVRHEKPKKEAGQAAQGGAPAGEQH